MLGAMERTGKLPGNAVALKTIVTTEMARTVAESYGVPCFDTFTGFKVVLALDHLHPADLRRGILPQVLHQLRHVRQAVQAAAVKPGRTAPAARQIPQFFISVH